MASGISRQGYRASPDAPEPAPPETARAAHAASPTGNRELRPADARETPFTDDALLPLFPARGQPALPPWRLALATMPRAAEGPSDRQAAPAVRRRIGWRCVLRLELTAPGTDWDRQPAICPAGTTSTGRTPATANRGHPVIKVTCSAKECRHCAP
jgi:hypothetical protein